MLSQVKWMNLFDTMFGGIMAPVAWSNDLRVFSAKELV